MWHHFARFHPVDEICYAGIDDNFGLLNGACLASCHRAPLGQIVNGVEEHVVQFGHLGLDIARHGQVYDEQRTVLALFQRALDHALAQNGQRTGVQSQ